MSAEVKGNVIKVDSFLEVMLFLIILHFFYEFQQVV